MSVFHWWPVRLFVYSSVMTLRTWLNLRSPGRKKSWVFKWGVFWLHWDGKTHSLWMAPFPWWHPRMYKWREGNKHALILCFLLVGATQPAASSCCPLWLPFSHDWICKLGARMDPFFTEWLLLEYFIPATRKEIKI